MPHSTSRRNVLKQLGSATLALTTGTRAFVSNDATNVYLLPDGSFEIYTALGDA